MQSVLLQSGHVHAKLYTPGQLSDECKILSSRNNKLLATVAVTLQGAVGSLFDNKAAKSFKETITSLRGD